MVCEARPYYFDRPAPCPFSSLFIGMVCEAVRGVERGDAGFPFQFPLHRDGV